MTDTILSPFSDATPLTAAPSAQAAVALASITGKPGPLYIYNPGTVLARVKVGETGVVATAASFPIPPGQMQPINPGSATHIAAWCASGTVGLELFALGGL
jgi:hypothetical protein